MKDLFSPQLETKRLLFEQVSHENVDLIELYRVRGEEAARDGIGEHTLGNHTRLQKKLLT